MNFVMLGGIHKHKREELLSEERGRHSVTPNLMKRCTHLKVLMPCDNRYLVCKIAHYVLDMNNQGNTVRKEKKWVMLQQWYTVQVGE